MTIIETSRPGTTHLPVRDEDAPPARPRTRIGRPTDEERFLAVGAWVGGFAMSWLVTQRLLPMPGPSWLVVVGIVFGVALTTVLAALRGTWVDVRDRVATAIVTIGALIVGLALVSVLAFIFQRGWRPLLHLNFFIQDMATTGPRDPFTRGGIVHAILGSAIELGIAVVITVPLGVGAAVFMTEIGGKLARVVRTIVEAMTALPSIVAGLFIYTTLIIALGFPRSGFAAAMAISVMILPIIARASDVVLRVVPSGLREASLALGASRWKTVWHVVLPTARPGLATALILGVARGVGETSPVLITSGAATFVVTNPGQGVMNSLPLFIFSTVRSGEPIAIERAFAAASVLLILVLALFVTARLLARPRGTKAGPLTRTRRRLLSTLTAASPRTPVKES